MQDAYSLEVVSVADSLTSVLRDRILRQQIRAGDRVAEATVAQQFGVSRPSARVAVERLLSEGLLERSAHHAARVPQLSREQLTDLYFVRILLESGSYEVLAREPKDLSAAHAHIERLHESIDGDVTTLVAADVNFHRALIDLLESPGLSALHETHMNRMRLCLAQVQNNGLLDPRVIEQEHRDIIAAIEAGDGDLAASRGREHLERARDRLLAHLDDGS